MYCNKHQKGFAVLLSMLLATSVFAVLLQQGLKVKKRIDREANAGIVASDLVQVTNAARQWVAWFSGDISVGTSTKTGINWLMPPSCGGEAANPTEGFLPCNASANAGFGQTYSTAITRTGLNLEAVISLSQANFPIEGDDAYFAILISQKAKASVTQIANPASGTFWAFTANGASMDEDNTSVTFGVYDYDHADYGVTFATVSNAANTDAWLRTDGSNVFQAALDMNDNDILNIKDAQITGVLTVAGNTTIGGDALVAGSITTTDYIGENLTLSGGVVASGNIIANDVIITDLPSQPLLSQGVYDLVDVVNGDTVTQITCTASTTAQIFTSFRGISLSLGGGTLIINPVLTGAFYEIQVLLDGSVIASGSLPIVVIQKCV